MPRPFARLARRWGALALLAAALAYLGACASTQATPSPAPAMPPAAGQVAAGTPRSATTLSPATPPVSGTAVPSTDADLLIYQDQGLNQPIWVSQGVGTPSVLAHGDWFRLSPGGRSVAFVRGFPHELWMASTDGSGERLLYTAPMGCPLIGSLLWSPDGTMVVFHLTSPGSPASQDPGALWWLDITTGAVRQLADERAHWPLFSPDSHWLSLASPLGTLVSHGSVGLIDVEGQGDPALFEFVNLWDRAWAADSSGFVVAFADWAAEPVVTELWWIPTGGGPLNLGQLSDVSELTWQPGGERLVYRRAEDDTGRLYLANRDGSDQQPLSGSEGLSLVRGQFSSWSPDGRWLLAMNDRGTLFLVDTAAPRVHLLDVQVVYGWVDTGQYLAGTVPADRLEEYERGEDVPIDVYRCAPLGTCEWLAPVPRMARLSYARP
jgi:dipeptidyl aminopeptidase/acylaminoacyl peptidase